MTIAVISHPQCAKHNMGLDHPEAPARLNAIDTHLRNSAFADQLSHYDAKPIEKSLLTLAHAPDYINYIFDCAPQQGEFIIDADTLMTPETLPAALFAAGAAIDAVDLVMQQQVAAAFCLTRPPGHHAEHNKAMGFCFFNNIALAAAYAKKKYQVKRIAIVDFDVHHGNGTEDIINKQKGYLFCSTFQYPLYPFSGVEKKQGKTPRHIINTPLAATSTSDDFRQAIIQDWLPALHKFQPDIIFMSTGFDAHIEDNISQLSLTESDYLWVTDTIKTIADKYAQGRVISVLEGGYALNALGRCAVAHLQGLVNHDDINNR